MATAAKPARVYEVTDKETGKKVLVKAANNKTAVDFVTGDRFESRLPSSEELYKAGQAGTRIIDLTVKEEAAAE